MTRQLLVIDDDEIDRESVKRALARPGKDLNITFAVTGKAGLELVRSHKYDCVFLDYSLPDMDGISMLRAMYDTGTDLTPAPVVMLTGQGNEAIMADALRWGAQDYIIKDNISTDTLLIAMAKACETFELKKSRKTAEDQLRHAQKMEAVGQLTSGVAHDFNNLLTVILGNTRIMQRRLQDTGAELSREDLARKVLAIESSAQRGAELVRRLMVFTRQRAPKREILDVNASLKETMTLMTHTIGESITTKLICGADLWPVNADGGQMENAVINLAVNARDAMPRGGKLTLETSNVTVDDEHAASYPDVPAGRYVMVAISDTGTGMPPAVARRVFEPFFTTKPTGQGTGLGLSMVYGFVRQSHGHIHVYSEEGHGTVFRLYLPRHAGEGEGVITDSAAAMPQGTETILVVEDDELVRTLALRMLEQLGYKTLPADSARTALEILKREHMNIDLIFTDIIMPGGMNGADLVKKAQEYYPGIRALYTSGYTENAIPDYRLIADEDIIGKPYRKSDLARKVRQILNTPRKDTVHAGQAAHSGD